MEAGEMIRWAFVQGDGHRKMRPAILLKRVPPFNDWIICAVSSQLHRFQEGLDMRLDERHPDFRSAGLSFPSIIRTAHLTTIPRQQIEGSIGRIGPATLDTIRKRLSNWICD